MELICKRVDGALVPLDDEAREWLRRAKVGDDGLVRVEASVMRNGRFFRKIWVLWTILFGVWAERLPTEHFRGMNKQACKDKFRRDCTIMAGWSEQVFNLDGTFTVEARSISYSKMDEPEFERLYSATIQVGLNIVGEAYTAAALDEWVDRILRFD